MNSSALTRTKRQKKINRQKAIRPRSSIQTIRLTIFSTNKPNRSKKRRKRILQQLLEPNQDGEDIEPEEQELREKLLAPILTQPNQSMTVEDLGLNLNDLSEPILEDDKGVARIDEIDPGDNASTIESTEAINDMLSPVLRSRGIGGAHLEEIIGHDFKNGQLSLTTRWTAGEESRECIKDMKVDHTKMTAEYIMEHEKEISRGRGRCPHTS